MSDPTTFTYTFPASPSPPEPELFAIDKLSEFGLTTDKVLARNPRTGGELVMPRDHFKTLVGFCSVFRSPDEHVAELMKGSDGSPQRAAAIRGVLQSFRDAGLTLSAQEICRELSPAPGGAPIPDKPVVVVITCDRPTALERLLGSILANCDLQAIDRLLVVDDSRSTENGARNREFTVAADSKAPVGFHYFGATEANGLMDALLQQLPEHEDSIRFLLDRERWKDHKSYGVARNFSHLVSVGKPVVVFDDDALCEAYEAPFRQAGVAFSVGLQEAAFFSDHGEWQNSLTQLDHDPVAGHSHSLGLTIPHALAVLGQAKLDPDALRPATTSFMRGLGRESRVLITECGSLGDPGTKSNSWLASLSALSSERLATTEGRLQQALRQRCCWVGRNRHEFRPSSSMSQVTGFDNRHLLPPYFPVGRGEDQIFGQATRFVHPGSVTLQYPWAVPHLPVPERSWTDEDNSYALDDRFPGTLFGHFLRDRDNCLAVDPQARLSFLARGFEDAAESTDQELFERFVDDRHSYRAWQIQKLAENLEQSANLPSSWRSYLADALNQVQSSEPGNLRLDSLTTKVGQCQGPAVLNLWRDAWGNFGRSLTAWSDIREAARDIVSKLYPQSEAW